MKKIPVLVVAFFSILSTNAQMSSGAIDSLVNKTLIAFDVPGIAIGIVKDGKIVHAKGYGVRSLKTMQPVDENTLFGIASNSKAFTTAALSILADEGKLNWDDKVRKYIPEFKLYDPYVTEEFTIRDLVTHRSGLGLGAGDLMFFPEGTNNTPDSIIKNLQYLKPVSSFRSKFDYDNNMFIVAGEVIHRISGLSWAAFIEQRIMQPLGFDKSRGSYSRVINNPNIIDAHAPVDGKAVAIPHDWHETANAAGGIMSNITDLSKWAIVQMDSGRYGNGKRLFSKKMQNEMWSPQMLVPSGPGAYNTHFNSYGLGWFISDVKGYKQVTHTGGLIGTVTQFILLPEIKLGIIVLTNQQAGAAFTAISNTIKDSYLGYPDRNWVKTLSDRVNGFNASNKKLMDSIYKDVSIAQKSKCNIADSALIGYYKDNWFGGITISKKNGGLWIACEKSVRLFGELLPFRGTTYVAKWNDRSYDADAYVTFNLGTDGKATGFKMEAISPATDFSFDFHDLDVKRVQ